MNGNNLFDEDFLWGASTASHQVEGNNHNNWSQWEKKVAGRLASTAEKRLSWIPVWDQIKDQATDPKNYISGKGVEHYSRYKEDFKLLSKLNLNSFRFGIEWSRIEPKEGEFSAEALEYYLDYVKELKSQGIKPMLNIWHWTHPVWFEDRGAFTKRKNIKCFTRFIKYIAPLIKEVDLVVTINEPNNVAWFQYVAGEWPPAQKGKFLLAFKVYRNLVEAHKQAYKVIKSVNKDAIVTSALQGSTNVPKDSLKLKHRLSSRLANYVSNTWYLKRVDKYQDAIGFNFYFKNYLKGPVPEKDFDNPKRPLNDLGWYMEPFAIIEVLRQFDKKFKHKPIIILENGLADMNDNQREWFIDETMRALIQARQEGINLIGYYHWSLLDNFEWAYGWWPKFGLVEVDRTTMKRRIRKSAKFYASRIAALTE